MIMRRPLRWMTIAVVGICGFALLARLANFCHSVTGRRAMEAEKTGKSMGTGGAMETAWAEQVVAAAGAEGMQNAGGAPSGVGVGSGVGVSAGVSISGDAMRDALVAQERAG